MVNAVLMWFSQHLGKLISMHNIKKEDSLVVQVTQSGSSNSFQIQLTKWSSGLIYGYNQHKIFILVHFIHEDAQEVSLKE